jgi:hypothetical protein
MTPTRVVYDARYQETPTPSYPAPPLHPHSAPNTDSIFRPLPTPTPHRREGSRVAMSQEQEQAELIGEALVMVAEEGVVFAAYLVRASNRG